MAPIRRYLRITKYSVLECRIYLDNPALAESWLLNPRTPVLPRVIEAVRPLVLPKLIEEKERSKGKGKAKKRGVKDVVVEDNFEVSIFLTETSTRHSLLFKQKHFRDLEKGAIKSNSTKLTGDTNDTPIEVEDVPVLQREDSDEVNLADLPTAEEFPEVDALFVGDDDEGPRRSKRTRTASSPIDSSQAFEDAPELKRRREGDVEDEAEEGDDKKKMAMDTTYDGFSIYGRVLCLVVKRKDKKDKKGKGVSAGQAMMEDWITSTQMPPQDDDG